MLFNLLSRFEWPIFELAINKAGVPLFLLIYINDPPEGLNSKVKVFADDTSLFSVVNYAKTSTLTRNSDLLKI